MNNTSTQITAAPVPPLAAPPSTPAQRVDRLKPIKRFFKPIASLRLTVVLFALSMFLVFCGTLAQMDNGLWYILSGYFRAWLAWIPFQVFVRFGQVFFWFPKTWQVSGSFPFPGGYTIGGALLINLIAAHLVRFRLSWKRSGILLTHAGLILLMLGELVTGLFAVEGIMVIVTGESSNYVLHIDKTE
ncbi:MAG: cytochrome c biogenesis protein ResB, partial [Gemmataceae bacterium]